jgi:hypothetical protein
MRLLIVLPLLLGMSASLTAQTTTVTSSSPPEAKLAAIDKGSPVVSTSAISQYARVLDRLDSKCTESRTRIGDIAVKGVESRLRDTLVEEMLAQTAVETQTRMNAHYSLIDVPPGDYFAFAEVNLGGSTYLWWLPITLEPAESIRLDMDNLNVAVSSTIGDQLGLAALDSRFRSPLLADRICGLQ